MASPTVGPSPFTRLNTPGGTPASSITCANKSAFIGAISLGFKIMVQPAASAGATLQAIWLIGQFHGVIMPTTPTGSYSIAVVPCTFSNSNSFSTFMACVKWAMPIAACAFFERPSGAPISWLIACTISA